MSKKLKNLNLELNMQLINQKNLMKNAQSVSMKENIQKTLDNTDQIDINNIEMPNFPSTTTNNKMIYIQNKGKDFIITSDKHNQRASFTTKSVQLNQFIQGKSLMDMNSTKSSYKKNFFFPANKSTSQSSHSHSNTQMAFNSKKNSQPDVGQLHPQNSETIKSNGNLSSNFLAINNINMVAAANGNLQQGLELQLAKREQEIRQLQLENQKNKQIIENLKTEAKKQVQCMKDELQVKDNIINHLKRMVHIQQNSSIFKSTQTSTAQQPLVENNENNYNQQQIQESQSTSNCKLKQSLIGQTTNQDCPQQALNSTIKRPSQSYQQQLDFRSFTPELLKSDKQIKQQVQSQFIIQQQTSRPLCVQNGLPNSNTFQVKKIETSTSAQHKNMPELYDPYQFTKNKQQFSKKTTDLNSPNESSINNYDSNLQYTSPRTVQHRSEILKDSANEKEDIPNKILEESQQIKDHNGDIVAGLNNVKNKIMKLLDNYKNHIKRSSKVSKE